jgi:D-alanyl-D-alanine carboxypeptidase
VSGDTLSAIAARYGVSIETIIQANGITDPASLQVGQEIIIPGASSPVVTPPPQVNNPPPPTAPPAPPPAGVGLLTLVDKQHALPADYVPPGLAAVPGGYIAPGYGATLRNDVISALTQMIDASGMGIRVTSGYRSYSQQASTFNYWVSVLGYEEASRVSAQAGHSEHQLGSTVDLSTAEVGWDLVESFGGTAAGQWLANNAHLYGFALSYPPGTEAITGYAYEPWHFRYIGVAEATAQKASGLTLNQYLGA